MLISISPAKKLDFAPQKLTKTHTLPDFLDDSQILIDRLTKISMKGLSKLMGISEALAQENFERYKTWTTPFTPQNAKQALLAFQGDVYLGMNAAEFKARDFKFAQDHLRILSGLYGVLRPLDLIQPYRLEMGTRLSNKRGRDLYAFWGSRITDSLNEVLEAQKSPVLVNLASNEYFKSVKMKDLNARIVTPVFKDEKNGKFKVLSFFAKKARGLMVSHIVRNRITKVEGIKSFDLEGYQFDETRSSDDEFIFTRAERNK